MSLLAPREPLHGGGRWEDRRGLEELLLRPDAAAPGRDARAAVSFLNQAQGVYRNSTKGPARPYPAPVSAPKIRLTAVIMHVLDVITSSPADNPAWGLR